MEIIAENHLMKDNADEFGISQSGAPCGSDGIPLIYLPGSDTKRVIHEKYVEILLRFQLQSPKGIVL
ncbi:hypothetical protein MHBO_002355 [Bonamia ostreae]|uniref:Uncharacterized protein n=1 Tax=Bonamia ostreae TaxID=126728 RepID=A0ABV2AM56_9EUKA